MRLLISSLAAVFLLSGCGQTNVQYAIVQEKTKDGVINQDGYVTVKPHYNRVLNFDGTNNFFNHPNYVNLHWIHDSTGSAYAIVQNIDGKFGIINPKGDLLLKPIYESITYFFNGFSRIEVGGKFGLIDREFKVVLKPTYDDIQDFAEDIAILKRSGKYGCINREMELKVKPTYDRIYFQQEDFLRTELNGKWGYLNNKCEVLSKPIYDYVYDFSNGIGKVLLDGKIGYMNTEGELITKQLYTSDSASF